MLGGVVIGPSGLDLIRNLEQAETYFLKTRRLFPLGGTRWETLSLLLSLSLSCLVVSKKSHTAREFALDKS